MTDALPKGHPIPWGQLVPYERQQGGYWLYPEGCDVYGDGKQWVGVTRPETEGYMGDLMQWLGEQLDEDERIARAASGEEWGAVLPTQPYVISNVAAHEANRTLLTVGRIAAVERAEDRAHITEHDPARVLREINAKRDLLRFAEGIHDHHATFATGVYARLEQTLRLYAATYADRPGYREDWRP
ncbi:DUF6221 family protein [Streptomyces sp. NPDC093223]|uniref:DUF6221 family protein n=1 Tax=Streptomyces sp. NPDC093223 TaxID=3366033 RepID=UPI0038029F05